MGEAEQLLADTQAGRRRDGRRRFSRRHGRTSVHPVAQANEPNLPRRISRSSNRTWSSAWIHDPAQLVCFLVGRLPCPSEELFLSHRGSPINLRQEILDQKVR